MACEGVTMIAMCVYVIDGINSALSESVGEKAPLCLIMDKRGCT